MRTQLTCLQQSYSCVDPRATAVSQAFFFESERQWIAGNMPDTATTVAALMLFGLACTLSGREQHVFASFSQARKGATRLQLVDVPYSCIDTKRLKRMSKHMEKHASYVAFGAYNWLRCVHITCGIY